MKSVESVNSTLTSLQKLQQDILKAKSVNELFEATLKSLRETKNNVSVTKVHNNNLNTSSLNFTFIFKGVPQNMSSEVDKVIVEELHLLFGVNTTSNVTSNTMTNVTLSSIAAETNLSESVNSTVNTNSTDNIVDTADKINSSVAVNSNTTPFSNKTGFIDASSSTQLSSDNVNRTNNLMESINQMNSTVGTNADDSSTEVITDGRHTLIPDTISSSNGSNTSLNDVSKASTNTSSLTNHTVANSTDSLNGTNITVATGIRSEFQKVMMMLLTSVDRAKWDMENINYKNNSNRKPRPPSSNLISRSSATSNKFTASVICFHLVSTVIAYRVL